MNDRLISLNAAIDAMMKLQTEDIEAYGASIPEGFDGDRAVTALKALPSAQPDHIGEVTEMVGDAISRQGVLRLLNAVPSEEFATKAMLISGVNALPSAQPVNIAKLQPNCNQVASDVIGRQAALDFACAMNACDEISDDAYQKLTVHFENMPSAQPGWIPVTERLPDKEGTYLCTVQGYVGKTTYLRIADFHSDIYVEYDIEEHKPGFIDYDSEYGFYEVTKVIAWCELPTPYREGGQDEAEQ